MNSYTAAPRSFRFWNILMPTVTTVAFVIIPSVLWLHVMIPDENGIPLSFWKLLQLFLTTFVLNILLATLHMCVNDWMSEFLWDRWDRLFDTCGKAHSISRRLGPSLAWMILGTLLVSPAGLLINVVLVAFTALRAVIWLIWSLGRFTWSCRPGV